MAVKTFCDHCGQDHAFRVRVDTHSSQQGGKIVQCPKKFDGDLCASCFAKVADIVWAAIASPRVD
jgi:hypothetical protein